MSSLCPKGPGGALRDSLSATAKRALSRSVKVNDSDGDEKGGAHSAQSAMLSYAATPDEALVAQFKAYRAGKAARSSPAAATFSAPPATRAISAQGPHRVRRDGRVYVGNRSSLRFTTSQPSVPMFLSSIVSVTLSEHLLASDDGAYE